MARAALDSFPLVLEGLHCTMRIATPAEGVATLTIEGSDTGELGDAPFRALGTLLAKGPALALFIDARGTRGASIGVGSDWALWLLEHREALRQVTMLTRSRLIEVTAKFVRQFAGLGSLMKITTDADAFEEALAAASE